ncbi:MAG: DEAD/DEAH box helicase [Flavobacteriales bacterium]|nr:DEAD/DEAH box helicase [Flavobacteriales bacterium]
MNQFSGLGISNKLCKALDELNIKQPTEIQEQAIPYLLENNLDFIGQAQTGTGKTLAFALPLLEKIEINKKYIQAVILVPTRELGMQISKQIFKCTKFSEKIFVETVYGGKNVDTQIPRLLRPTHIIVATPGRLIELVDKKIIDLSRVNTVVLDEADEMLSLGFKKDLNQILSWTLSNRKIWMFSATFPPNLNDLVKKYISSNTYKVKVDPNTKLNRGIQHRYFMCSDSEKLEYLVYFLQNNKNTRGIIFCRTKETVKQLEQQMQNRGFDVDAIHGDKLQKERTKIMRAFKSKKLKYVIATDLMARGIDVDDLEFVIHYELPDRIDYYTHRSGRTARAGKEGISLALIKEAELKTIKYYEKNLGIKFSI